MAQHPGSPDRAVRVLRGCGAGAVATAAMSAWMAGWERLGVLPGQPPRMLVDEVLPVDDDASADAAAAVSHLTIGVAAGGLFGLLGAPRRGGALVGAGFGLALWVVGYEGWMPALRVLPPAHRDDRRRVGVMIGAHVVYGAVLGALAKR